MRSVIGFAAGTTDTIRGSGFQRVGMTSRNPKFVIAGLDPAINDFVFVDGRHKGRP
jgi:hypothetical protein